MIAQLRGTLLEKSFDRVVVEVSGIGYGVLVSLQTLAELPAPGSEVTLRTHLQIREDAHLLFGFASDAERRAFELCISVSGIGPKLAMALLSALRPEELSQTIVAGDVARLSRTPGIGKKTAERLVVELRDKFEKLGLARSTNSAPMVRSTGTAAAVSSALVHLGYRQAEAERAAEEATKKWGAEVPLEQLVKEALRALTG